MKTKATQSAAPVRGRDSFPQVREPEAAPVAPAAGPTITSASRFVFAPIDKALLVLTSIFIFVLPMPHTVTIRLSVLFLAVLLSIVVVAKRGMPTLPLKWPIAAWTVVAGLSLLYAIQPWYSLAEIKSEILYGVAAYFLFYSQSHSERQWNVWLKVLLASLAVLSLGNIILWANTGQAQSPWYFYNGVGSYTSFFVTTFPFVLLLFFLIPARGVPRVALRVAPFLFLIPVLLTRNRAVWFAFAISTAVLFGLVIAKAQTVKHKRRLQFALVLLVVVSAVLLYGTLENRLVVRSGSLGAGALIEETLQRDLRLPLWKFLISEISEHPWRGAGFGLLSFDYAYPEWQKQYPALFHAHNIFVDAGVQMGVPGILVMVLLFCAVLREYWRLYRSDLRLLQWIGACGIAMVIGMLVKNMTDHFFTRDLALMFWALVGMSLGYAKRIESGTAHSGRV